LKTTVIYSDGGILKPNRILRKWMGRQRKFIAILIGDSLIIKKLHYFDYSSKPNQRFLSIEKTIEEVHNTKKQVDIGGLNGC